LVACTGAEPGDCEYNSPVDGSGVQLARLRAFVVFGSLCVGLILGSLEPSVTSVVWMSAASGLVALAIVLRRRFTAWAMVMAVVALGGGWMSLRAQERPADRLDQILGVERQLDERVPVELTGILLDPVRTRVYQRRAGDPPMWASTRTQSRLKIDAVYLADTRGRGTWSKASGIARVILPDSLAKHSTDTPREIVTGDRVWVVGMYAPSGRARNLGDLDWRALSAQSGRVGSIVVNDESMIEVLDHDDGFGVLLARVRSLRAQLRTRAMAALGLEGDGGDGIDPERAMEGALLLGEREPSFGEVYSAFQRVGVAHVLAISGFHLALVIMMAVVLLRLIGEHARIETGIIIAILVLGMLVVPMRPPIVRAGVIVAAVILAGGVGRRYDRLTVLAWVGIGLLIWRPMDVFSLGYQLSMGITGLLIVLSDTKHHTLLDRMNATMAGAPVRHGFIGRVGRGAVEAFKVNLAAWAVAMPTIALHVGMVSIYAPLVSLVLIPMVMVLMVLGYMQIGLGVIAPAWATHTIGAVDWIASLVASLIGWVDGLPYSSVRVSEVGAVWTLAATVFIVLIVSRRWKVRTKRTAMVGAVLIVWVFAAPMISRMMREPALLRIDMLDVGDGSCVLVQSQGEGLIWDCGSLDRRVGEMAARAARRVGLVHIGDAIVTHDNLDHFNGLVDLAPVVGLERVWVSRRMVEEPSSAWGAVSGELRAMGVEILEIRSGDTLNIGGARIVCLWPDPAGLDGLDGNDTSVVVRIDVGEGEARRTIVLDGDIEGAAMDAIEARYPELHADIIELAHHGSARVAAYGFVGRLDPEVVLQSTGPSRLNDPRWDSVRPGRVWRATADRGGIWVKVGRDGAITTGSVIGE
jgi:competence protein ComEC